MRSSSGLEDPLEPRALRLASSQQVIYVNLDVFLLQISRTEL